MPLRSVGRQTQDNAKMALLQIIWRAPQGRKGSRLTLDEMVLSLSLEHIYMSAALSMTSQENRKIVFLWAQ